jgi:predicted GIY-YIG superfamily endonuclease
MPGARGGTIELHGSMNDRSLNSSTPERPVAIDAGNIVRHADYESWGPGYVIRVSKARREVFFIWGGRRRVLAVEPLQLTRPTPAQRELFQLCATFPTQSWSRSHHSLYAVELDPAVRERKDFRDRNPGGAASGCLYVGITGLKPEQRFERHLEGTQSARLVKKYGRRLRLDLVEGFSRLPYQVAAVMEPKVAAWLRAQGFGVWQN